jgi:hypothetical protein
MLPSEVISEIFLRFLPIYPLCPPLTGILSPTLLTHICRQWREIALETPDLWRAISLSGNVAPFQVSHMLGRSGSCPLSIRMDAYNDSVQVSEFFAAVAPHCQRREYLKLRLSPTNLSPIQSSLPLLRHLDFVLSPFDADSNPNIPIVFASGELPLLRTVILNDIAALSVTLPWVQLTSLTLTSVYVNECVPLLQQTSNLVHCELELYWDSDDDEPEIVLPCLESLTLNDPYPTGRRHINYLQTFIVPALCSLEIPERFFGNDPIDSLKSFISKSGCTLQEVRITGKNSKQCLAGFIPTRHRRCPFMSSSDFPKHIHFVTFLPPPCTL